MANPTTEYTTTLGTDAVFKGELKFEKAVRLLGRFEGQVESPGELVIAEGANLSGEVKAGSITVEGNVKGELKAGSKIVLASSGRLEGDITSTRLEVADGAVLIGRCMIGAAPGGNGSVPPAPREIPSALAAAAAAAPTKGRIEDVPGVGLHPARK